MRSLQALFRPSTSTVGVALYGDTLRLAVNKAGQSGVESLYVIRTDTDVSSASGTMWRDSLKAHIVKQRLQGSLCNVVMAPEDYQLLLVEAPNVPDEEMRDAVKWRVKDLISEPIENTVMDVFFLPSDANKTSQKMLYVVVTERKRVLFLMDLMHHAGLQLNVLDIEVLALRNILLLKQERRSAAVVRLKSGGGEVSIYRNGNLYLSRQFKLDYKAGLLDDLPTEHLTLEIQRSFDYFERQMGQVPPGVLYLYGEGFGEEKITEDFRRSMPVPIELLTIPQGSQPRSGDDTETLQLCLGAMGAACRDEVSHAAG